MMQEDHHRWFGPEDKRAARLHATAMHALLVSRISASIAREQSDAAGDEDGFFITHDVDARKAESNAQFVFMVKEMIASDFVRKRKRAQSMWGEHDVVQCEEGKKVWRPASLKWHEAFGPD